MESKFTPLDNKPEHEDAVLSFPSSMFKINEFMISVRKAFESKGLDELENKLTFRGRLPALEKERCRWFDQGVECEVLRHSSKGWQKGKVRIKITMEFCHDEPEVEEILENNQIKNGQPISLLDDVRQMIPKAGQ